MNCEICKHDFDSLDKHHIHSRSKGGSNKKDNIAYLCPNCHRLAHRGFVIIEGRFMAVPDGDLLVWRKYTEDSITGAKDPEVYIMGKNETKQIHK